MNLCVQGKQHEEMEVPKKGKPKEANLEQKKLLIVRGSEMERGDVEG